MLNSQGLRFSAKTVFLNAKIWSAYFLAWLLIEYRAGYGTPFAPLEPTALPTRLFLARPFGQVPDLLCHFNFPMWFRIVQNPVGWFQYSLRMGNLPSCPESARRSGTVLHFPVSQTFHRFTEVLGKSFTVRASRATTGRSRPWLCDRALTRDQ